MVKKHIILKKRRAPVQINLPNGRSFTSRWERISRKQLPINIKVSRNRTIGPREANKRQKRKQEKNRIAIVNQLYPDDSPQIGSGIGQNLLKAEINLGWKAIGSDIGKKNNKQGNRKYTKYI